MAVHFRSRSECIVARRDMGTSLGPFLGDVDGDVAGNVGRWEVYRSEIGRWTEERNGDVG